MKIAALLIPLFVIVFAAVTKRLIPSLFIGVFAGGLLLAKGDPITGVIYSAEHVISSLQDADNVTIILVLFLFGAIAEIIKASGGIKGFIKTAEKRVKTEKGVYGSVWILSFVTFIDCCFHTIATGTISKPLLEKAGGSKRKLASIINITSCLLIILIPLGTTYAGYIVGTISQSLRTAGIQRAPYTLFLESIPFNAFAIAMTVIALVLSFTKIGFKKEISSATDKKDLEESEHGEDEAHEQCKFEQNVTPRVFNLILPLILLIALILFFALYTGSRKGGGFFGALQNADYEKSIFIASAVTLLLTSVYYTLQRMPLKEIEMHFLKGGMEMIPPITILIFSWGLSSLVKDLGFTDLISGIASAGVPLFLIPATIFLLCCLSSYFMGSAWGTWALVMPIAVSLAAKADISLPLMIGAVLAGGSLGDNASPLGETAVLSASVIELPLMEHVKSQLPISLMGVGISALFFLAIPLIMK